ncbi:membrane protein [Paenibacillus marchantiophytorum]|uniref:Membrane protein n=1 Tax=Paenibacillus marchantiophytorum TaxID=1619310 RepID=A0ABQ2BVG0_9BACL|nr:HupE/UreJ family protein [Paenibacillus marchantiophytorum]GGI45529.1 membrane protein [Paenibacillus marchantiophytorum]
MKTPKKVAAVMACTMVCFILTAALPVNPLLTSQAWMLLQPETAMAHNLDVGFSNITLKEDGLRYELLLLPDELSPILNLDLNRDGAVTIEEANQVKPDLEKFVARSLSIKADDADLQSKFESMEISQQGPGIPMVKLNLDYTFEKKIDELVVTYDLLFNVSPLHRNFVTVTYIDGSKKEHNFDKNNRILPLYKKEQKIMLEFSIPDWLLLAWNYIWFGMEHLFTGYDHLLFLLGLVIVRLKWNEYLKIITAFTIGHSITLVLAALEIVEIPGAIIEPLIALSIVFVAAENILRKQYKSRWLVTAFFGLIHGFGFAGLLEGRFSGEVALPLFSFNLGIELGQLAVLLVLLPIIHKIGQTRWKVQTVYGVSCIIGVFGIYWFLDRVI